MSAARHAYKALSPPPRVQRIEVYFDYGSPYAYLAWQRITHVHAERYHDVEVLWKPVSAGHLFQADGSRPNTTIPNQARHLWADLRRWADAYDVPFAPPPDGSPGAMPVRSLDAMRLHFVADQHGPAREQAWMEAVYLAYFRDGIDISDRAVLAQLVATVMPEESVEAADRESVKRLLAATTKEAYQAGAPGVPYTVLDGHGYWGNDRLAWVEARLRGLAAPDNP
jgi:2-hydroxychromene-2-carboxylate isomerase